MSRKPDSLDKQKTALPVTRDLSADQWMADVVGRHTLLAGINIGEEGAPKRAIKTAFEMNQKGSIPRFEDLDRGMVSSSLLYTEQCREYVTFGFSEVTAKASYGFVSASIKRSRKEQTAERQESKTLYTLGHYRFSMIMLTFAQGTEPYEVKPTQEFLYDIDDALKRPTLSQQYAKLVEIFDDYGHVFPIQVTLGGQLYIEHSEETTSTEVERQSKSTIEAAVNLKLGKFEANSGFEYASGEQLQQKSREIASKSHFESVGGDTTQLQDPQKWVESLRDHKLWRTIKLDTVVPILEMLDDGRQERIKQVFDNMLLDPPLRLTRFEKIGDWGDHQVTCTYRVPSGYKIISGGAQVEFKGNNANMLYASYPVANEEGSPVVWTAESWDCKDANPGRITIAVIAMYDPENEWDVKLFDSKTDMQRHAQEVHVNILPKYHLTGGGAAVDSKRLEDDKYVSAFLVSSYPKDDGSAWIARTHDHVTVDLHNLEAYAIGIRPNHEQELQVKTFSKESESGANPSEEAVLPREESLVLLGGGAHVHEMPDHHLIASYPGAVSKQESWHADCWRASSTERARTKASKLTAYAIGVAGAVFEKPKQQ